MTEIQQNRWDQLVRRAANIVGGGSQVNDTLNELFPVFDVENLPPELFLLGGIRLCMGGGSLSGVVAQSPKAQLFNPVGSGVIVTLTDVNLSTDADSTIRWGPSFTVAFGAAIGTQTYSDLRQLPPALPVAQVRQLNEAAFAAGTNQSRILATSNFHLGPENGLMVLPPGTGFEIGGVTTNLAFVYGFYWRERLAEPAELNL